MIINPSNVKLNVSYKIVKVGQRVRYASVGNTCTSLKKRLQIHYNGNFWIKYLPEPGMKMLKIKQKIAKHDGSTGIAAFIFELGSTKTASNWLFLWNYK